MIPKPKGLRGFGGKLAVRSNTGVFNVFQGKDPLGDRDMEQGRPIQMCQTKIHIK